MKAYFTILFLLPLAAIASAQRAERVTAWTEVQQTDGRAVLSCWCQNHTSSPLQLRYKAILFDQDTTVREGTSLALPDQPNLLLNASFLVEDGQFERLEIYVYQKDALVAKAFAVGPAPIVNNKPDIEPSKSANAPTIGLDDLEIGRLVLDDTRSKLAHDFYELFYNAWSSVEEDIKVNYTINIREMPNVIGIGTRILVEVDGQELTQLNLQPRAELVENLSVQLVESLYNHFTNPDEGAKGLQIDDISGTGIY